MVSLIEVGAIEEEESMERLDKKYVKGRLSKGIILQVGWGWVEKGTFTELGSFSMRKFK